MCKHSLVCNVCMLSVATFPSNNIFVWRIFPASLVTKHWRVSPFDCKSPHRLYKSLKQQRKHKNTAVILNKSLRFYYIQYTHDLDSELKMIHESKITGKFKHTTKFKQHLAYCSLFQTPDHNKKIQTINNIDNINIRSDRGRGNMRWRARRAPRMKKVENYKNNVCWFVYFFHLHEPVGVLEVI